MRNRAFRAAAAAIVFLGACSPLILAQLPGSSNASVRITTLSACRAGLTGRVVVVNDAITTSDCTVGGATGDAAHRVICLCDVDGAGGFLWRAGAGGGGGGGGVDSVTGSTPITSTGGADPVIGCSAGTTSARGCNELATSAETTAGLVVQASDTRLSDSRAPTGAASGDLTGTYPGPTVAANSVALGTDTTGPYAASATEAGSATSTATDSVTSASITDGSIVNADVSASAAIALSKLAAATASKCARFDGSGVLVPATGDCASGDTTGSASPGGSGSELQFRGGASTFGAVTGSSVSGSDLTLGGLLKFDSAGTVKVGAFTDQTFFGGSGFELRNAANTAASSLAVADLMMGAPASDGTPPRLMLRASANDLWSGSNFKVYWSDTPDAASGRETNVGRIAPGVVGVGKGTGDGDGYTRWGGQCRVATDQTNATATMANSGCAMKVWSGRTYAFGCHLFVADSVAIEGVQIDLGGGTATLSALRAQVIATDSAPVLSSHVTSPTTAASAATFTGDGTFAINGGFTASSDGTFQPRFAQVAHTTGTATLYALSYCLAFDMP